MKPIAAMLDCNPLALMTVSALSCTFAFVLPISTPPNMIVFATGLVPLREMAKTGAILSACLILAAIAWVWLAFPWIFGEGIAARPAWRLEP